MKENIRNYPNQHRVDDFVMVKFGYQQYPAQIIDISDTEFYVSSTLKQRKIWRYPDTVDNDL